MPICDSHMHLWDLSRQYYAWLQDDPLPNNPAGNIAPLAHKSYLPVDYLSHTAGYAVLGTVHVECGLGHDASLAETDWLESLADDTGIPSAIVAGAQLEHQDAARLLEAHAQRPRVRGIRQIVNWHQDETKTYTAADLLANSAWQRGFARLEPLGLAFDLQAYPLQLPDAARLAARNPRTTIVLNHAGMPTDRAATGIQAWDSGMALLAEQPNVRVKISGLGMVDRAWTEASIRPFILRTIDLFGPARCMFASNFPVDSIHGAFATHYAAFDRITAAFTAHERRALFAGTARDTYRLAFDLPPETIYEART